jgi:hypothetical protein
MTAPGVFGKLSARFRAARDVRLRKLILAERRTVSGRFRILDVGGRADYWARVGMSFLEAHDIEVLIVNYAENARALSYKDNSFDLVHSNSVIEHVGGFADKRAFASEVLRLAPAYYVQTPYFWFPIDPHWPKLPLFHWMPMSWRWRLLCRFKLGFAGPHRDMNHAVDDLEATVLLDWEQMRGLFPDAEIRAERFFGLPKSVIAERGSSAAPVLDSERAGL